MISISLLSRLFVDIIEVEETSEELVEEREVAVEVDLRLIFVSLFCSPIFNTAGPKLPVVEFCTTGNGEICTSPGIGSPICFPTSLSRFLAVLRLAPPALGGRFVDNFVKVFDFGSKVSASFVEDDDDDEGIGFRAAAQVFL